MWEKSLPGLFKDVLETETKKQPHMTKPKIRTEHNRSIPDDPARERSICTQRHDHHPCENVNPNLNFTEFWSSTGRIVPTPAPIHSSYPSPWSCVEYVPHTYVCTDQLMCICIHITYTQHVWMYSTLLRQIQNVESRLCVDPRLEHLPSM